MIQGDNVELILPFAVGFDATTIQSIDIKAINDKKIVVQSWAKTNCAIELVEQESGDYYVCKFYMSKTNTAAETAIGKLFLQGQITVPNTDFPDGVQVHSFETECIENLKKKYV